MSLGGAGPEQARKRVQVACDYCRVKRLKCTANRGPCLNCQLYGVECKKSNCSRRRGGFTGPTSSTSPSNLPVPDYSADIHRTEGHTENGTPGMPTESPCAHTLITDGGSESFLDLFGSWDPTTLAHGADPRDTMFGVPQMNVDILPWNMTSLPGEPTATSDCGFREQEPVLPEPNQTPGVPPPKESLLSSGPDNDLLPGVFMRLSDSRCGYIGGHSIGATLALCIQDAPKLEPELPASSHDWLAEAADYIDHGTDPDRLGTSRYELPPKVLSGSAIDAYFDHVHPIYPILDKEKFKLEWEQLYSQPQSRHRFGSLVLLTLVVAIGAVCDRDANGLSNSSKQLLNSLQDQLQSIPDQLRGKTSVETVQIMIHQVIYLLHRGQTSAAWYKCGLAIRTSQTLGLHRKPPSDLGLTEKEVQLRSQVWWTAFSLDASCSMAQGRPPAALESDCDVDLLPLAGSNNTSTAGIISDTYVWRVRLAKIENRLSRLLVSPQSPIRRVQDIEQLDNSLQQWRNGLPTHLRPEEDFLVDPDTYQFAAVVHLEYFNILRAIHWASVNCARNFDHTKALLGPRMRSSEALCIAAARSFVRTLNEYDATHGFLGFLYVDSGFSIEDGYSPRIVFPVTLHADQYMAALGVLYRNICRNPRRASAKSDLAHFYAAKEHLKRDLFHGSYESNVALMFKELFEGMLSSAEKFIKNNVAVS